MKRALLLLAFASAAQSQIAVKNQISQASEAAADAIASVISDADAFEIAQPEPSKEAKAPKKEKAAPKKATTGPTAGDDAGGAEDADEGEDKMIKAMRREGKTPWDIAKFYTGIFPNSRVTRVSDDRGELLKRQLLEQREALRHEQRLRLRVERARQAEREWTRELREQGLHRRRCGVAGHRSVNDSPTPALHAR